MSFFSSLFGGAEVKKLPQDSQLEDWQSQLFNYNPGMGYAAKKDKSFVKALDSGNDVSSFGQLNSVRQQAAAERRDIGDQYGYGANGLIAAGAGEQANLLNRAREIALDKSREREGMNMTDALIKLRQESADRLQQAHQFKSGSILNAMQAATGSRLGYYDKRYQIVQNPGILNTVANLGAAAGGIMTGAGALKFPH